MNISFLILCFTALLIPKNCISKDSRKPGLIDYIENLKDIVKKVGDSNDNSTCLTCDDKNKAVQSQSRDDAFCEDLFSAACLTSDEKNKGDEKSKNNDAQYHYEIMDKTRNAVAKQMGFTNFEKLLKQKLQQEGLVLSKPLNQKEWESLKGKREDSDTDQSGISESKKLFEIQEKCESDSNRLENSTTTNTESQIQTLDQQIQYFQEATINLLAKDIPSFYRNLESTCEILKRSPSYYKEEDNQLAAAKCKVLPKLKLEAIDLFRQEGSDDYIANVQKYVRENFLPDLVNNRESSSNHKDNVESDSLRLNRILVKKRDNLADLCYKIDTASHRVATLTYEKTMKAIFLSKPAIDTMIDEYYSQDNVVAINALLENTKNDTKNLLEKMLSNPTLSQKIAKEYDNLKLELLSKPAAAVYSTGEKNLLVLDQEKSKNNESISDRINLFDVFSDPSLSFFSMKNAYFAPTIAVGSTSRTEHMVIMPAFIKDIGSNSFGVQAVMAHELAHKIDPDVSRLYKNNLSVIHDSLMACYKDKTSIRMQIGQEGEVFSDYFSSEIVALNLQRLPSEIRKNALVGYMKPFCSFENEAMGLHCMEEHPETSLRVSGIFGANPNVRKAIGCNSEASKYKSCGLEVLKE